MIKPLVTDGILKIGDYEKIKDVKISTKKWLPCKWVSESAIFKGMHLNGVPCGWIRCINNDGAVYEGIANQKFQYGEYGWGREIVGNFVRIGWWT